MPEETCAWCKFCQWGDPQVHHICMRVDGEEPKEIDLKDTGCEFWERMAALGGRG